MKVLKKKLIGKSAASSAGDTERASNSKVYWRCCVTGCKSNKSILRHAFPKDVRQSNSWRDILKNPDLDELSTDLLRNYRVCQLHFSQSSYTITSVRRILRNDAVPELLLDLKLSTETNNAKNSVDSSINMELKESSVDIGTTESANTSGGKRKDC